MFELNGQPYTLEDLQESAKSQNIEFENFMDIMKVKGLTEKTNHDFLQPYNFSIKSKDGSTTVFTGDDAMKVKNKLVYKNQSTNIDEIAEYNENEFSQWVTEILPNSNVVVEDTGLFWDDKSIVKIPGMDAMTIDLQPMTSGEGVSGVLFGGGKKLVAEQIAKIIKFAEDRYENENKYVGVYTDWAPNAYDSDSDNLSTTTIRDVKGFDRLQKMYQKIGLKITKETGGYTGSTYVVFDEIEGKEVFRGTAELNGGISDFMYNYSKSTFSEDQHNTLKLERQAQVAFEMKPTWDQNTGTHTNIEKILYDDSSLENIVRTSAYNSDVERNKIKILLENQRKNLNIKQSDDVRLLEKQQKKIVKEAVKNGITSIEFDENLRVYTLKGSNKEQVSKYTNLINDWLHTVDLNKSLYLSASNDLDVEDANIIAQEKSLGVGGGEFSKVAAKSRSVFGRSGQAFRNSWDKLVLSPFVMFGSDAAIKQQNLIQQRYDKKYSGVFDLTAGEAFAQGRFLEYALQVSSENGAITTLSLATAGVGSTLGAGVKATQWTIAGVAAFSGGGDKRLELENLENSVEDAQETLNDLEKYKNLIPKQKYQEISLELNKFIADNDYSGWQQFGSVSTAFLAEGFFTKYIGASNFTNAVGGLANPLKDLSKRIFMENTEATLRGVVEIGKGIGKEILEEELIYVSNVLADVSILNRDFDSKEFIAGGKKVAIDAAIISGPMVGTGTTYSTVMTQMATAPIKAEYNKIKKELQGIDADLKALDPSDVDYQSTYDGLMSKRSDLLYNKLGMLGSEMELGAMSLEGKDLNNLIISGRILDDLIAQAGIDPTLSDKLKNKKIQEYAKSLDPEKALEFKKKYNSALEMKKEALSKVDFTNSVKNLGIRGEKILEKLIKKNPKLKNATTKKQAIAVYAEFKNYLADVRVGIGRNNPETVELVESILYGEGGFSNSKTKKGTKRKKRNLKAENDLYYQLGAVLQDRITKTVVISNKDNSKAASILQDVRLQDITTVAASTDDVLQEEIMQAYDEVAQQEIDKINKSSRSKESKKSEIQKILAKYESESNQVINLVRSGKANAAIIGDKYIVRDKEAADAAIREGDILAGTALSHEVGHAIDALAFDTAGITNYGKNLFDYMEKNFPKAHKSAVQIQITLGNYNIKGEFPKGEDKFYDEYSKEIQSYFIRNKQEQAKLLKITSSIPNVLRGIFGLPSLEGGEINIDKGYEIKTPKDAAVYLASFLKGYENGEMGTLQKRRIDRRKKLGLERGETQAKFSEQSPLEAINSLLPGNITTQEDYYKVLNDPRIASNAGVERILDNKGNLAPVIEAYIRSRSTSPDMARENIEAVKKRLANFDPAETRADGSTVGQESFGEFIFANARFGKMVAAKKLAIEAAETKRTTRLDDPDVKDIADEPTKTKKTEGVKTKLVQTKSRQLTSLADLDIESSALIKETTRIILAELIKSNPKNLVQEIQNVLVPDLVEIIRKEMGVIGERKGELVIPESYKAYLADTYQQTISSMEILKIRTNYKNLFKKEKMGFADYKTKKSDKTSLKKDSNYRKDIFRNVTTKAEFTKYHTEGKKNKLIANQRNLALMRAEAEAIQAADNYIIENSNDLNQVYAAELRSFIDSKTIEKQKLEDKSFDSVKFSAKAKKYALDQIFLVEEISKKGYNKVFKNNGKIASKYSSKKIDDESVEFVKELYFNNLIPPSSAMSNIQSKAYSKALSLVINRVGSRARSNVYEWVPINIALEIGKSYGLEMLTPRPAEGGLPDFHATLHGFDFFVEGKLFDAQHGSATIKEANLTTGEMEILNNYEFNPILREMWKSKISNIKDYASIVVDLMREKGIKISELKNNTPIPEEIFLQLGAKGLNLQKTVTAEKLMVGKAGDIVGELYAKKKLKDGTPVPNYYINILGKGLRWLSKNIYQLDVPKFEGDINMIMRAVAQSSKPKKAPKGYESYHKPGMKYYALNMRFIPVVDMQSVKGESKYSIDNKAEMLALLKSDAVLEMKRKREKINSAKLSKSVNISRTVSDPRGITVLDFDDTLATTKSLVKFTTPGQTLVYNASPKSIKELGKRSGIIYLATDKKEADAYAKSNRGEVRGFVIDDANIVNEDVVLKEMKDQGVDTSEGLLYEMIDSRFPDFYIGKKNVDKVFNALRKKGIKAFKYEDGSQVSSKTTKSIAVIDKSVISEPGTLNAEQYASTYQDLLDQGYTFDFSDFNKVVKGKLAPLFNKAIKLQGKFGPENMFVLTARPPQAQKAIFDFLKANGLNIPLKNITGLGNSTAEAKALWIADKVGEGFNDFYFADDALQNVQAVKNMLDQFDVKSKVQQAKVKFSESMNNDFNDILEEVTGIESKKRFDFIKARKRGASKGKFRLFIPPSHEDFAGLLYNFMGKGRRGDAHRKFLEKALLRPLNRANIEYDTARQSVATDYKNLNKAMPDVKKKLLNKTPDGDFIYQDAVRVYLWDKHGYDIPGLSPIDQKKLVEIVTSDSDLQYYAETINLISKQETYVDPTDGWDSGDIRMDLDDATGRIGRAQFFEEFIENADIIFSKENLNKIEAGFGKGLREALEDMLYRIKTGRNKPSGQNKMVNDLMNWVNGSVGSVMFFNMRSALLQQMSLVNYINFADNNIFAAAKAFANQKQYWDDWGMIFNSDMLKQRRGGIQTDVNGAELAAEMRKSKNPHRFLISKLLELGFLPTQIGDNIAIATGGATFYRNRVNTYLKDGLSKSEAEKKAFVDFQDITQSTQQSARPDMVSQQQASLIGKIILNFQNVTSQFNRLGKKAFLDIKNRRITGPNKTQMQSDISNAARITYYFAVQNLIFYTLQTAMFAMMFDDDEEDVNNLFLKKRERLINGSIDSVLRGSGILGAVISTLKNVAIAFARQRDVNYNPDESAVIVEAFNFSPVLGIKARKVVNAEKTLNYNKKVIKEMETFDIDNPQWSAVTNYIEGFTNLPLNRLYNKTMNVRQGLNNEHAAWERALMFLGWSQYNLNLGNKKIEEVKAKIKADKKIKDKKNKKKKSNLQTL